MTPFNRPRGRGRCFTWPARSGLRALLWLPIAALLLLGATAAHAQSNDSDAVFDHASTGFDLFGAHSFVACESCHMDGQFKGTPSQCVACHEMNGRFNARAKPVSHITSSQQCEHCHNPTLWQDVPWVDHSQVFGSCGACHNNVLAPGRPPDHIPVFGQCQDCHSTLAWQPAFFSHDLVSGACVGCHNNVQAQGRPVNHINISSLQCDGCHNTMAWQPMPASQVNHDLVLGACVSCHNNVDYPGKFPGHRPTSNNCEACHNPSGWQNVMPDLCEFVPPLGAECGAAGFNPGAF